MTFVRTANNFIFRFLICKTPEIILLTFIDFLRVKEKINVKHLE